MGRAVLILFATIQPLLGSVTMQARRYMMILFHKYDINSVNFRFFAGIAPDSNFSVPLALLQQKLS